MNPGKNQINFLSKQIIALCLSTVIIIMGLVKFLSSVNFWKRNAEYIPNKKSVIYKWIKVDKIKIKIQKNIFFLSSIFKFT